MITLKACTSNQDYQIARTLFREYASQIGVDLKFQNFHTEIKHMHTQYAKPKGALIIAYNGISTPVGCFGIRTIDDQICELKRMYLKQDMRGKGYGKILLIKSKQLALELGYTKMRLDTLPTMNSAIRLYQKNGFYEIELYRFNPIQGAKYMEVILTEINADNDS